MLGHDVALKAALVQVACDVGDLVAALVEVLYALLKQTVVVCLEADFRVGAEEALVHLEFARICQPAFFVSLARPGVAEVDEQAFYPVLGSDDFVELLDVVVDEQKVVYIVLSLAAFLKQLYYGASAYSEHVDLDVDRDEVDVRVLQGELTRKAALAAADFKAERLIFRRSCLMRIVSMTRFIKSICLV